VLHLLCYCLPVFDKICRMAMNFVFFVHTCITRTSIVRLVARYRSVGIMQGHYRSPTGRSKLVHHAVCAIRPIIVGRTFDELLSCYSCNHTVNSCFCCRNYLLPSVFDFRKYILSLIMGPDRLYSLHDQIKINK